MQQIVLTEEFCKPGNLFPFTLTRPTWELRVGILTIREKWNLQTGLAMGEPVAMITPFAPGSGPESLYVSADLLPSDDLLRSVTGLVSGQALGATDGAILARRTGILHSATPAVVTYPGKPSRIRYPWEIVALLDQAIRDDYDLLTRGRTSAPLNAGNTVTGSFPVFVEPGASVEYCYFNTTKGPVYIGPGAELMEGSFIRGPFALGERGLLKMGSKVYGATSIGPYSIAAGEIKNSILFAYSNKAHDGYLGDSVVGEWCNFGAGTTNSNLKNNAGEVRMWTPAGPVAAGNKCGVMMGDYTRTSINTSINTGTVIGISANVFGSVLTPKYIPSFAWGSEGNCRYELEKAITDIRSWKKLKGRELSIAEEAMIKAVYQQQ